MVVVGLVLVPIGGILLSMFGAWWAWMAMQQSVSHTCSKCQQRWLPRHVRVEPPPGSYVPAPPVETPRNSVPDTDDDDDGEALYWHRMSGDEEWGPHPDADRERDDD